MSNHFENHWSNNGTVDTYTTSSQSSTRGYAANETHHESHSDTPNGSEHVVIHTTTTETHVEPQPKPAENNEIVSNGSAGRNDPTAADIANKGALSYRNRNNASSIFDGMVAAPEESPRKRGGIQNNAPALYPATTQGTSMYERQQVQPKQNGNPLTGEGYGPRDGTGIGALRQHSKVPPGGFTSDFWRE